MPGRGLAGAVRTGHARPLRLGRRRLWLGLFARGTLAGGLDRTDQDVGVAALQARLSLDGAMGRKVAGKAYQQFLAEIGVGDFAPTELDHGLHSIAFRQEADGVVHLEVVVMIVGVGTEL